MRIYRIAPLAALVLLAVPVAQAETKTGGAAADKSFIQLALKSGQEEIALAKLAVEKSRSGDITQFAQMLVSDHTQVNEQLSLLAKDAGATAPPRSGNESRSETLPPATSPGAAPTSPGLGELGRLSGTAFDQRFLAIVVQQHETSVALYEKESTNGSNPAAKKLATEALPKIKDHLQQAKSLVAQRTEKKSR